MPLAKARKCCCICSNFRGKEVDGKTISLHRFPARCKLRRVWLQRSRLVRKDFTYTANSQMCSDHFANRSGSSKEHPVPSIFPNKEFQTLAGLLIVCKDSDIEFFADCSDEEADMDRELTEGDKWKCAKCETRIPAVQRYCNLCWKPSPGWLPDESEQNNLKSMPKTRTPSSSDSDIYPSKGDGHCARPQKRLSPKKSTQVNKDMCKEALKETCEGFMRVVPKQYPVVDVTDSGVGSTQPSSQDVVTESTTKAIASYEDKTPIMSESLEVRHSLLNFRCVPARKDSTPSTDFSLKSSVSSPPKKSRKDFKISLSR